MSGISIPPSGSCTVQVDVTSNIVGLHNNQTSGVTSTQTLTPGNPSNIAQLRVLTPATIAKSFSPSTVTVGIPTQLTITLTNPNPVVVSISNPGFTDTFPSLPGQMVVASTPAVTNTCGATVRNLGDTDVPNAGDVGILVRGGNIPANGSCVVTVNVTTPVDGNYTNTTSILTTAAGTSPEASANLTVEVGVPDVKLLKSCPSPTDCITASQIPGTDLTYRIDFTNVGNIGAQNLVLTDKIPNDTDFQIGSVNVLPGSTGLTILIEYSDDYDPLNPTAATWTYTPVSGGGGAPSNYDRKVKAVRWRVSSGILSNVLPNNTGYVEFKVKIR